MGRRTTQSDAITTALGLTGRGLLGIGRWLWRLITGKPAGRKLNQVALFADWQKIDALADTTNVHQAAQAVSQADRFFDHVMQLVGARGLTFADRIRSVESKLNHSTYQAVWDAHKLRNQLAHEHGMTVTVSDAKRVLNQFRVAARELGAF